MPLIGLVPFVLLFAGLGFTRMRAHVVTALVLVTTLLLASAVWNTGSAALGWACLEGLVTAVIPIIWVIFAAVFSYAVSVRTGGMDVIRDYLRTVAPDPRIQAVLIAFCFGGFLEAVAGFGTAVAIPTAMLISMGVKPLPAATMALVANSVPVAFGALGIPVLALAQVTGLDAGVLTRKIAIQLLPFAVLVPVAIAMIAGGGVRGIGKVLGEVLLIGVSFTAAQTLIAFFVGPELVAVGGSLAAFAAYLGYCSLFKKRGGTRGPRMAQLAVAVSSYAILLALVLATRLVDWPALQAYPLVLTLDLGGHPVRIDYLTTPGTLLVFATMLAAAQQGVSARELGALAADTVKKIRFSALTIIFVLMLAKTMSVSGMVVSVAAGLAGVSQSFFPFLSPILGAIGTFVTGSDTSSNILLGELQKQTAIKTGFDPDWLAAANTSGATAGKMISPQSIHVAASVVGIESRQSELLRRNLVFCAGYLVLLGSYIWLAA